MMGGTMRREYPKALALGLVLWISSFGAGQTGFAQEDPLDSPVLRASSMDTARGLALGTGGRSSSLGASAVLYNTAALSASRIYHMEALAGYRSDDSTWAIGAAIADSISNRMASGLACRGLVGGDDGATRGLDCHLGFGVALAPALSIGLSGRYFKFTGQERERGFTMDASIQIMAAEGLTLSALGYNLIPSETTLVPTIIGGSAAFALQGIFSISADCLVDMSTYDNAKPIVGGGLEVLAADVAPIRVGYRFDTGLSQHSVGGGIGYVTQQYGLDFGLRYTVGDDPRTEFVASIRYHVD